MGADRIGYERQGTAYDPHAVGHELVGRDTKGTPMPTTYDTVSGMPSYEPEFEQQDQPEPNRAPSKVVGDLPAGTRRDLDTIRGQRLRQDCLEMAVRSGVGVGSSPDMVTDAAAKFYAFVTGKAEQEDKS